MDMEKESLIDFISHRCNFYKDSDRDLECGASRILRPLLKKGRILPEEIANALRD